MPSNFMPVKVMTFLQPTSAARLMESVSLVMTSSRNSGVAGAFGEAVAAHERDVEAELLHVGVELGIDALNADEADVLGVLGEHRVSIGFQHQPMRVCLMPWFLMT
jgi:hypothetical protein